MSDIAIRVENVSKKYTIGEAEPYQTLRDSVSRAVAAPFRWLKRRPAANGNGHAHKANGKDDSFWALKDVSFEVKRGEVLGVIGRNGAGKSTLLKVLSRITEPTTGQIDIFGRVGSLLEVGTGFHPELTGRENVFLNGAILGMSRAEIKSKFDEIVDFSGVEKFIDTPVKRYSTGMQVRLAFAVAAHLDPEILIIDEVLAVGDAEFQRKCLGKMDDVAKSGRTVLFVSHNMAAVEALCTGGIILNGGRLVFQGTTDDTISAYFGGAIAQAGDVDLRDHDGRPTGCSPVLTRFRTTNSSGEFVNGVATGEDVCFEVTVNPGGTYRRLRLAIRLFHSTGHRVVTCHNDYQDLRRFAVERPAVIRCTVYDLRLAPGRYSIILELDDDRQLLDKIESGISFEVLPSDVYGTGKTLPGHAAIYLPHVTWDLPKPIDDQVIAACTTFPREEISTVKYP